MELEQLSKNVFSSLLIILLNHSIVLNYISLPFSNWFEKEEVAEKRSSPILSNFIGDYYYKKPIKFVNNGKPTNIFQLFTTTTTTPEPPKEKQDSAVTWLGNFFMNGLPKKLWNFKAPYSPLSWFNDAESQNFV